MVKLKQIEDFIASEHIAMVGVSRDPKKFGFTVFKELKEKGMNILPVNPHTDLIHGVKVYPDLNSLPAEVKSLLIMTQKSQTASLVRQAKEKGFRQIWIQQMSESNDALKELKDSGINYITGQCILMYYKPHSVHKFHGLIKKIFLRFPK